MRTKRDYLAPGETQALKTRLQREVGGEVRFDAGSRAAYATDASNYRQVPVGVVLPRDDADVEATLAACREWGVPLLARGGGTSLAGQSCNTAIVLDFSKHHRQLLELNPDRGLARVQPGIVLDRLREAAGAHRLTFGPDPATHAWCTLGGMIGNNSCGTHGLLAGRTSDNVERLEVLTYDGVRLDVGPTPDAELARIVRAGGRRGAIYAGLRDLRDRYAMLIKERYPRIPRRVSGFNLDELLPENGFNVARALVGTESTCAVTLTATLRLVPDPGHRRLLVLGYPDFFTACDHVPEILGHRPIGLEGLDSTLAGQAISSGRFPDALELLPEGGGWLLVELGGATSQAVEAQARQLVAALPSSAWPRVRRISGEQAARVWALRESALGLTARPPGRPANWDGWEDSAVDPARLGAYLRDLTRLWREFGYSGALYGHVGEGCVHTRNDFDLQSDKGVARWRQYMEAAADLCVGYGGSLSGEHGDGQARGELLDRMFGEELVGAFRVFKRAWDPDGMLNPGKVVDPAPLDANLRLGGGHRPLDLGRTSFAFPEDTGGFASAVSRCVGVGRCRQEGGGGTMCPSYMVTRDETHSTRGRARLLFELLQGEVLRGGWRDHDVRRALDLCISCKSCKTECPVGVDMATYKAEFLSHYYRRRLRPRTAYTLGMVHWVVRAAAAAPRTANRAARAPLLGSALKRVAGLAPDRTIPPLAARTFRDWFARRPERRSNGPPVLLWPDTFTNHFSPAAGRAAVEVLEDAGFAVRLPRASLCCGRPLYDYGMVELARRTLRRVLEELRPAVRAGVPLVVLEPSCLSVFRDELLGLFPDDADARRLAATSVTLAELLVRGANRWRPPRVERRLLFQGHCHQRALASIDADVELLRSTGAEVELLDAGCCGMAGAFGFESAHYELSMRIAESALLPKVRAASPETLVIADGFSCSTQIQQATGRPVLHTAEVLQHAMREGEGCDEPHA